MTTLAGMRRVTSASSLDDDDDDESSLAASPSAGSASPSFRDLKVAAASWKMVSSPCCARTDTLLHCGVLRFITSEYFTCHPQAHASCFLAVQCLHEVCYM